MSAITIIGAGFAALTAVKQLRKLDKQVQIDLIAPKAEFVYLPGLIWIPTGLRQAEDLIIPLDGFFERMQVHFHADKVKTLAAGGRQVITESGQKIDNDGLIIACGGRFIKKLPGIEHVITPCEGIAAAEKIKQRLHEMDGGKMAFGFAGNPKEPAAMRGGPVFEFLFGIDRWLRKQGKRDRFELIFFSPAAKPGQRLGEKAVKGILNAMQKKQITTYLGHKMKGFTEKTVITEGTEFASDLTLFMPGMTGNPWFKNTDLPLSEGGMLKANALCQVEGQDKIYVAGDAGSFPGPAWLPKQAHMADLQAEAAAKNLWAELNGQPAEHRFKTELMCIIDSYDKGIMVYRTEHKNMVTPPLTALHWAKRFFEHHYLKAYK